MMRSPPDILCFYRMRWRWLLLRYENAAPAASRCPLQPPALPLPLPDSGGEQPQRQPHDCPQPCHCVWTKCLSVSRKPLQSISEETWQQVFLIRRIKETSKKFLQQLKLFLTNLKPGQDCRLEAVFLAKRALMKSTNYIRHHWRMKKEKNCCKNNFAKLFLTNLQQTKLFLPQFLLFLQQNLKNFKLNLLNLKKNFLNFLSGINKVFFIHSLISFHSFISKSKAWLQAWGCFFGQTFLNEV